MPPNPRVESVRAARRTTRELKILFGQMGTTEHPRGKILRAYRNVRRGAKSAFREIAPQFALNEVLQGFRAEMSVIVGQMLIEARLIGRAQAEAELEAWGLRRAPERRYTFTSERDAWLADVDAQIDAANASQEEEYILGGDTQQGILQPAPVIMAGAHWLSVAAIATWVFGVSRSAEISARVGGFDWWKQAVPAIDERTTDCCLRVAGQSVPLDDQFHLTGTPRYADHQDWSPFHDWCRTSVVLVLEEDRDDELTERMVTQAQRVITLRNQAKTEARGIVQQLIDLGTPGDSRRRDDDTAEIQELRQSLLSLRPLAGYDLEEPA